MESDVGWRTSPEGFRLVAEDDRNDFVPPHLTEEGQAMIARAVARERQARTRWRDLPRPDDADDGSVAEPPSEAVLDVSAPEPVIDLTAADATPDAVPAATDGPSVQRALVVAAVFLVVAVVLVVISIVLNRDGDTGTSADTSATTIAPPPTTLVPGTDVPASTSSAEATSSTVDPPAAQPAAAIDQDLVAALRDGQLELTAYYDDPPLGAGPFSFALRLQNISESDVPLALVQISATSGGALLSGSFISEHEFVPAKSSAVGTFRVELPAGVGLVTVLAEANGVELGRTTLG